MNSLKGTHIATGQPVEVMLSKREVLLIEAPFGDINDNWEKAMEINVGGFLYRNNQVKWT